MTTHKLSVSTVFKITFSLETLAIIAVLILAAIRNKRPSVYFDEGSIISYLSFLQLLLISFLSHKIYQTRKGKEKEKQIKIWQIITAGFVFFAIDEVLMLHERFDFFLHDFFEMEETRLTDRIDDFIVFLYAGFGFYILYLFRSEFLKYRGAFPLFIIAFILFVIMFVLDTLSQHPDDLSLLIHDSELRKMVYRALGPIEEMFKIWAEGMLIVSFYSCLKISKKLTIDSTTSTP